MRRFAEIVILKEIMLLIFAILVCGSVAFEPQYDVVACATNIVDPRCNWIANVTKSVATTGLRTFPLGRFDCVSLPDGTRVKSQPIGNPPMNMERDDFIVTILAFPSGQSTWDPFNSGSSCKVGSQYRVSAGAFLQGWRSPP